LHPIISLLVHSPTTAIYALSLHDALPIWSLAAFSVLPAVTTAACALAGRPSLPPSLQSIRSTPGSRKRSPFVAVRYRLPFVPSRSEEHTSELQSRFDLVCRLLLEKKKIKP